MPPASALSRAGRSYSKTCRTPNIVDVPWVSWPEFRDICANMHLLIQPSFDETFNVVTADGIAEGVPSVTNSAIEWTPTSWWARCEDPSDIMRIGIGLLHAPAHAVAEARVGLKKYVQLGTHRWLEWLSGRPAPAY